MLRDWWPPRHAWWIVAGCAVVFLVTLGAVLLAGKGPVGPDLAITSGMNQWALDSGTYRFWQIVTYAGQGTFLVPCYTFMLGLTVALRKWRALIVVVLASLYAGIPSWLVKISVLRPRPPIEHSYNLQPFESFPSGHTGAATAFATAAFCVVAMSLQGAWRVIVTVALAAVPILTAASRLALGVHFPTDLLGAASFAIVWVLGWSLVLGGTRRRPG